MRMLLAFLGIGIGILGGFVAEGLLMLIRLMTNLAFAGQWSFTYHAPETTLRGPWVIAIPALGGLVVGALAKWGSAAIRGHGIPEVMDQVLHGESRIPARLTILKPLSAAVAIGTGGPFGAEGPIIATGGALGSLLGQIVHVSADERKTLLAAGAAAGMAATFGSPVAAVLLAIELLLFEYRAASIIPVALAASAASAVRLALVGGAPVFPMPNVSEPSGTALVAYTVLGAVMGLIAVGITRGLFWIEDRFDDLPVAWYWWPALGGLVVGLCGYLDPRILGVGYQNISAALGGQLTIFALATLVGLKLVAWTIALGSGTSGGTLAPLFTFGSGIGAIVGAALALHVPSLGVAPPIAALVGMAAIFTGASRALLTSVIFAFETTRQPVGLLPLLAGCCAAYFISKRMMRNSIMTEKLARRGALVLDEYAVDYLARLPVADAMSKPVVTLSAGDLVEAALTEINSSSGSSHQGFPVVESDGRLIGVLTRRDLAGPHRSDVRIGQLVRREPVTVRPEQSLREAADTMVRFSVGRLPVVDSRTRQVIGIVTRSDVLRAHASRLQAAEYRSGPVRLRRPRKRRPRPDPAT